MEGTILERCETCALRACVRQPQESAESSGGVSGKRCGAAQRGAPGGGLRHGGKTCASRVGGAPRVGRLTRLALATPRRRVEAWRECSTTHGLCRRAGVEEGRSQAEDGRWRVDDVVGGGWFEEGGWGEARRKEVDALPKR